MACCGCAGAQGWFPVGSGANALNANGSILTICTDSIGNLYAAGGFLDSTTLAYGRCYVAKWDHIAQQWSELGTGANKLNANEGIETMFVDGHGNVYVAGSFTDSIYDFVPVGDTYVAKWDGSSWSKVGTGANKLNGNGAINSICMDKNGNIYAAGTIHNSAGYFYVAKWDGTTWSELGDLNANININSICVDDSLNVFAAGNFTDGAGHAYVAKWSNSTSSWSELGTGFDSGSHEVIISYICISQSHEIYASVNVSHGFVIGNVFKWDGTSWSQIGSLNGINGIGKICVNDSNYLYVSSGSIDSSGFTYVAKFNPILGEWNELGFLHPHSQSYGNHPPISALWLDRENNVYAAGDFSDSISATNDYRYVAEYGPTSLSVRSPQIGCSRIKVFPNPARQEITIESDLPELTEEVTYRLYDAAGKIYRSGVLNFRAPKNTTIDIQDLTAGIYLLQVNNDFFKIIKN